MAVFKVEKRCPKCGYPVDAETGVLTWGEWYHNQCLVQVDPMLRRK